MNLNNQFDYLVKLSSLLPQIQEFQSGAANKNTNRNVIEGLPYQIVPQNQSTQSDIERVVNAILSKVLSPITTLFEPPQKAAEIDNSRNVTPKFSDNYSGSQDIGQVFSLLRHIIPNQKAEPYISLIGEAMNTFGAKDEEALGKLLSSANLLGISGETVGKIFGTANGWSELAPLSKINTGGELGLDLLKELKVLDAAQHSDLSGMLSKISDSGALEGVLSTVNTISNWGEMSNENRLMSVFGSSNNILSALDNVGADLGLKNIVGQAGGAITGGMQVVKGVEQFKDVIDVLGDMSRGSTAVKFGAIGGGTAGAAIGAGAAAIASMLGAQIGSGILPGIGTVIGAGIGALVGCFGSSKKKDQMMRDQWREGLEGAGFANKADDCHVVPLADGSTYKIGLDGKTKLKNIDGTERQTFDVDWGNKIAADSIPMAHLYAMATGLDHSMQDGDLFTRAAVQSLNAATSNATSLDQVRDNFKSMMAAGSVDPMQLAAKCEFLRVTNKISESEYGAYINNLNYMFDMKLVPSNRAKAHMAILNELQQNPNPTKEEAQIMMLLTDEDTYNKSLQELEERLHPESKKIRSRLEAMLMQLASRANSQIS
jgi:hypothetical protein